MASGRIEIKKGQTFKREIAFSRTVDGVKTPIDIIGATVFFTVKASPDDSSDDSTALLKQDITSHTSPAAGVTEVNLATDSLSEGSYSWDIKIKYSDSSVDVFDSGSFIVRRGETNRS